MNEKRKTQRVIWSEPITTREYGCTVVAMLNSEYSVPMVHITRHEVDSDVYSRPTILFTDELEKIATLAREAEREERRKTAEGIAF